MSSDHLIVQSKTKSLVKFLHKSDILLQKYSRKIDKINAVFLNHLNNLSLDSIHFEKSLIEQSVREGYLNKKHIDFINTVENNRINTSRSKLTKALQIILSFNDDIVKHVNSDDRKLRFCFIVFIINSYFHAQFRYSHSSMKDWSCSLTISEILKRNRESLPIIQEILKKIDITSCDDDVYFYTNISRNIKRFYCNWHILNCEQKEFNDSTASNYFDTFINRDQDALKKYYDDHFKACGSEVPHSI